MSYVETINYKQTNNERGVFSRGMEITIRCDENEVKVGDLAKIRELQGAVIKLVQDRLDGKEPDPREEKPTVPPVPPSPPPTPKEEPKPAPAKPIPEAPKSNATPTPIGPSPAQKTSRYPGNGDGPTEKQIQLLQKLTTGKTGQMIMGSFLQSLGISSYEKLTRRQASDLISELDTARRR